MVFNKIEIHNIDLERQKEVFRKYAPNDKEFNQVIEHLRRLAIGEITGRPIGEKRQSKLLDMFALFFKNFQKSTFNITKQDLEKFKEALLNDKIRKDNGNPYSDETKEDCTETIIRYIECSYPHKITSLVSSTGKPFKKWFTIRASKKTPEILSEGEIEKLLNGCKTIEGKYIISVLFDSGARIEEFLNIRFEDIEPPTQNFPYYKIDFREEYSKTEGRKIGLYWKNSTDIISKYLQICEKKDQKDQVFSKDYDAVRMFLSRLAKKVLNKRVNPHMLRKSSATFYADKLNRQQLCIRYGWKFSSDMPDVYISRAGVDEGKIKEVMFNDDLNVIKKENGELKTKQDLSIKEIEELKKQVANMMPYYSEKKKEREQIRELAKEMLEEARKEFMDKIKIAPKKVN